MEIQPTYMWHHVVKSISWWLLNWLRWNRNLHCTAACVFVIKYNIVVSFNIPSQTVWPTFYFGCGAADERCAYKSWNKQRWASTELWYGMRTHFWLPAKRLDDNYNCSDRGVTWWVSQLVKLVCCSGMGMFDEMRGQLWPSAISKCPFEDQWDEMLWAGVSCD